MSEDSRLLERLQMVLSALERIPARFASIKAPSDFVASESGLEHMDGICKDNLNSYHPRFGHPN